MTADSPAPTIEQLDTQSHIVLRGWLGDAARLGIDVESADSIEAAYEKYFDEVLATDEDARTDPTTTLTAIGMALGEHLRRTTDADWRIVTDDQGRDLALVSADEASILFPVDPIADNWAAQQRGWLVQFIDVVPQMFQAQQ